MLKQTRMKLGLALFLILALAGLAGCAGAPPAPAADPPVEAAPVSSPPAAPDEAAPAPQLDIVDVWARPSNLPGTGAGMQHGAAMGHGMPAGMAHGAGAPADGEDHDLAMMGPTSAVFMVIKNTGDADDQLIAARTDVAAATELHESSIVDDVMQMRQVPGIAVPAGGEAVLQRGGLHVMLLGVHDELKEGDQFTLTLVFEQAGERELTVTVRSPL